MRQPLAIVSVGAIMILSGLVGLASVDPQDSAVPTADILDTAPPAAPFTAERPWFVHAPGGRTLPLDAFGGELPNFEQRDVADRIAIEPMVAFSHDAAFFNPLTTVAGQWTLAPEIWRSLDQGLTWTDVTPNLLGVHTERVITGDPYLYADPLSGRLFSIQFEGGYVPYYLLPDGPDYCNFLRWTDDGGSTWSDEVAICPGSDHQTLFSGPPAGETLPSGYPSILYMCDNKRAGGFGPSCARSLDGGATWSERAGIFPECEQGDDRQLGHGHASQADGTVYVPKGSCRPFYTIPEWRSPEDGDAWVSVSRDGGAMYETVVVDDQYGFIDLAVEAHEARVATDGAGNAYYLFLDREYKPRLSVSSDQGSTWSTPMDLSVPGIQAYFLSDVVAGDNGKVAWTYVASDHPGGWEELYRVDGPENATWHTYVGMTLDALDADPTLVTTRITPADDPVHRGPCPVRCLSDWPAGLGDAYATGSPSGIGMYDFINMEIDPSTGAIWVSMMDMCYDACSMDGTLPYPNDPRGAVGVQTGGPLLTTPGPSATPQPAPMGVDGALRTPTASGWP